MNEPLVFCQGPDWKPRLSTKEAGTCGACGAPLVGRNHWFCPSPYRTRDHTSCRDRYMENHRWGEARSAAIRRDKSVCRRCGGPAEASRIKPYPWEPDTWPPEVNHIVPRNGQGYGIGCHNHQDNLATLCHACHLVVTAEQRGFVPGGEVNRRRRVRQERDKDKLTRWVDATQVPPGASTP